MSSTHDDAPGRDTEGDDSTATQPRVESDNTPAGYLEKPARLVARDAALTPRELAAVMALETLDEVDRLPSAVGNESDTARLSGDEFAAIGLIHHGWFVQPPTEIAGRVDLNQEPAGVRKYVQELRDRQRAHDIIAAEKLGDNEPQPVVLSALLDEPDEPLTWRIDGLMPIDSRVLLYAQKKTGKTTAVGDVVKDLVDGGLLFGQHPTTPIDGKIAIIDTEMSRRHLRSWLRDKQIENTDKVVLLPLRGNVGSFNIADAATRERWAELLVEHDVRFVILDCLRPVLDVMSLDESHDIGRFLVYFDSLLTDAEIGESILVHHAGHNGLQARGDSRVMDGVDAYWRLRLTKPDDPLSPRLLFAHGRDVAEPERQLVYDEHTRRLTLDVTATQRESTLAPACEVVLEAVHGAVDGELSFRRLQTAAVMLATARGLEIPRSRLREAIEHLSVTGQLRQRAGSRNAQMYSLGDVTEVSE